MYLRIGNLLSRADNLRGTIYHSLSASEKPFYLANLLVDSNDLTFTVEPWDPEELPHQQLYGCGVLGAADASDPSRYRARGWARIAGSKNYAAFGAYVKLDLLSKPELLESHKMCVAAWDWMWHCRQGSRLAALALQDPEHAFGEYVGWPNKIEQRLRYYDSCRDLMA